MQNSKHDVFFYRQPPLEFTEELKSSIHQFAPEGFGKRNLKAGEVNVQGMYLKSEFCDSKRVLDTAFEDFNLFLSVFSLQGKRYPIIIRQGEVDGFESHCIDVQENACFITSNDTEGIRRALIWIENEVQIREGAFLPMGKIQRKPHIKRRITRGFYSPTNRAPKFGDELLDDIDYYPCEYLNRLAHDGMNAIWIYTSFSALLPSSYITEYGENHEKRIEKLNKVIEKCSKYGVKVYIFAIEPAAFTDKKLMDKYPEVLGNSAWGDLRTFCTHSEFGKNYCIEATQKLVELAPDLGGIIALTAGERISSCAQNWNSGDCPHCSNYKRGDVLAQTTDVLREGMRRANSDAELVSWTYGHRLWDFDDIRDYVEGAPDDVTLMQNFDDMGYDQQLGRTRLGVDYWLSYAGPSELFSITAEKAQQSGKHMYAKMQVCCSHELASVPYIPVPGLLFEKYKGAHKYGVEGVMQCWYFGG